MKPRGSTAPQRDRVDTEAVRAAHPLAGVVTASGVRLTARGRGYLGCCPFHEDATPSLSVDGVPGRFHCFGCGAHGDVIDYVTQLTGLPFREAVQALQDGTLHAGPGAAYLPPPRPAPPARRLATTPSRAHEINALAWEHFTRPPAALHAQAYLRHHRGIDLTALHQHTGAPVVGYAGTSWHSLARHLTAHGVTGSELVELDLCHRTRHGDLVDTLRGRLILPVRTADGQISGFLGRDTTGHPAAPKYRNPTRTPIFDKAAVLYRPTLQALDTDAIVVVVEGPLDALAIAAAAATAAAPERFAPCSTGGVSLSPTQAAAVLQLHPCPPVIALDGDDPGREGTGRWLQAICLHAGRPALVTTLPEGSDPAAWLATAGTDGLAAFDPHHVPDPATDIAPRLPGRELVRLCAEKDGDPSRSVLQVIRAVAARLPPAMAEQLRDQAAAELTRQGANPRAGFGEGLHHPTGSTAPPSPCPSTPSLT